MIRAGLVLLVVGALLSLPLFRGPVQRPLTVFVCDTSASSVVGLEVWDGDAGPAEHALARWLREAISARLDDPAVRAGDARVLAFGAGVRQLTGELSATELGRWARFVSDTELVGTLSSVSGLDGALARAEELLAGRTRGRVVVLGDGSFSGPDPAPRLAAMAERGIELQLERPPHPLPDLALAALEVAPRVALGARARAGVEVVLEPAQGELEGQPLAADLLVDLSGPGGTKRSFKPWGEPRFLGPGPDRLVAELDLGVLQEGAWELSVALDWQDGFPLNDQQSARFMVGSKKRVLVVTTPASEAVARAYLGADAEGLAFSFIRPSEVEAELGRADLLVTWDLPLSSLPAARLVSELHAGLGWLNLGAWGHLEDPAGRDPELAALLPLQADDERTPPRRVILCVDGSGSMSGAPFDAVRRAAVELVRAAPAKDAVSLAFFTNDLGAEWEIRPALEGPLAPAAGDGRERALAEMAELMGADVPGGDTAILNVLRELLGRRRAAASVPALVILLSDGAENELDVEDPFELDAACERARGLAAEFRDANTTLAVISINVAERSTGALAAARRLLGALVSPGGELHEVGVADGAEELTDVFAREVAARLVAVGDFQLRPAGGGLARELGGLDAGVRTVARYTLAPGARPLAMAVGRERLGAELELVALASAELRGGGRVGMLACAPGSSWAPEWHRDGALLPLMRWLASERTGKGPAARREGDWLVLDGIDALVGMVGAVDAVVRGADGEGERSVVHLAPAPTTGGPVVFRGRLPRALATGQGLEVDLLDPGVPDWEEVLATLGVPGSSAGGEGDPDRPRLGGLPEVGDRAVGEGPRRRAHSGAPWALGLALVCLFAGLLKRS